MLGSTKAPECDGQYNEETEKWEEHKKTPMDLKGATSIWHHGLIYVFQCPVCKGVKHK